MKTSIDHTITQAFVKGLTSLALDTDKSLPLSTLLVLALIACHPEGISSDELNRQMEGICARGGVHRALQRLHEGSPSGQTNVGTPLGLIVRWQNPEDRKGYVYALTQAGTKAMLRSGFLV